ncbi:MAG TPA: hypothetical protein VIQ30_13760, partial [Pseudonocardia sp.]
TEAGRVVPAHTAGARPTCEVAARTRLTCEVAARTGHTCEVTAGAVRTRPVCIVVGAAPP